MHALLNRSAHIYIQKVSLSVPCSKVALHVGAQDPRNAFPLWKIAHEDADEVSTARLLWLTRSRILSKHHLSAARSLWQTQSKILSKHHLSAARPLWQTQSKILSKHHLSAARSLWQTPSRILSKHHLSAVTLCQERAPGGDVRWAWPTYITLRWPPVPSFTVFLSLIHI